MLRPQYWLAGRLPDERFGAFTAILDAIEYQIEEGQEGQADPTVLRHLRVRRVRLQASRLLRAARQRAALDQDSAPAIASVP